MERDPSEDEMLRTARDHARKLAVALAADEKSLIDPKYAEGRAALAELIAAVSGLANSIERTTAK